ncbi:MAG TPA: BrnA antitoxin family protein [Acetobacteraceae bacterium]|jgi:uncharacterized protein (DUF4415 family)
MPRKGNFVSYSAKEAADLASEADWAKVAATSRDTIEQQMLDDLGPLPEGWEKTVVIGVPEPRQAINIRLDAEVLRWFKAHGPRYQTRINAVLRAFVSAKQREERVDAPSKSVRGNRSQNRSRSAISPAA